MEQLPFYVRITLVGPNNSSHPKYNNNISALLGENTQIFKIIEIDYDKKYSSKGCTYITEDGYCLWSYCTKECTQEEYCKDRKIISELKYEIY